MQITSTYVIAAAAGYGASLPGMPLPWMLGPFLLFAILSAGGLRIRLLPHGRELGQVAIGLAIGLRFTPPVMAATFVRLPEMLAATLYLLIVTTMAAFLFRRLARVDPVTAFFATAAGGVADMAHVAHSRGGVATSVAVVHALRVSLVVAIAPFIALGAVGRPDRPAVPFDGSVPGLIGGLVFAYFVARALKSTPLPNPWLVGPILAGIVLGVAVADMIQVPGWLITVAQILLGTWLGCQFRRELLSALPRVTASGVATGLFLIAMALLGAALLQGISDLSFITAFLSLAPAAVTEMVLVAKVMHLDAETVAAFHVVRILIVSTTVLWVFRLYYRIGRFSDEP